MSPRIAVELTSERTDGTWTWRAAGARQPKGVLDGKLLPPGVGVGDVVRAEADIDIDGITVTSVLAPKGPRRQPERVEIVGSGRVEPEVTSTRSDRGESGPQGGERPPRRSPRGSTPDRRRPAARSGGAPAAGTRTGGPTAERPRPERPPRRERPVAPSRPKPKKLRAKRTHRDGLLAALPPEQQPIAEQALRGGMPAVRTALEEQSAAARAEGKPEIPAAAVLAIAEGLLPRLRVADWLDRADAALADAEELALADLRSVVVSGEDVARDQQTREPAAKLKAVLERRTEVEQREWREDLEQSLAAGRVVRALRLSSRSPQPGERLPPEIATALSDAAGAAMTSEVTPERWATLLDAVAYSALRKSVVPAGVPAEPGDELMAQVRKHAGRVPAIAALFGVDAPTAPARAPGGRRRRPPPPGGPTPHRSKGPTSPPDPARPRRIPPPPENPGPGVDAAGANGTGQAAGPATTPPPVPDAPVPEAPVSDDNRGAEEASPPDGEAETESAPGTRAG